MSAFDEIRRLRIQKLDTLKEKGKDPFPINSARTHTLGAVVAEFDALSASAQTVVLAGRIMSLRPQGGLAFFTLDDGTGRFQGLIKTGEIAEDEFTLFINTTDVGDFVEITGTLFVTARGEKTIKVLGWNMLAKSLRPLPEKWSGLQDPDERFRRRYLDTLMSPEVKARFLLRSNIITAIRTFLNNEEYLEVETPMLVPLAGGATAEPFTTHHNALDMDLFLRIAPELYLKKLLIGGFPKVYEINRNFRNEGIDVTHNPEFTMLEFYEAYSDKDKMMQLVERMIKTLVTDVLKKDSIVVNETEVAMNKPFAVATYAALLSQYAGITNPETISKEDALAKAEELKVKVNPAEPVQKIVDMIYKKVCRPFIVEPTFIIDYPADYLPLAKRTKENSAVVDVFQLVIGGVEIVKAFSELNDPIDQRERFSVQDKQAAEGDAEAQTTDEDFVEALEYGMPPAGGAGIGIDRLVMLLTNTHNIKEVILFPTMRRKE